MPRAKGQVATVIAIDPGVTTGVAVVSIDPAWITGKGPATWEGLGFAIKSRYIVQIGRYPKAWNHDDGKARNTTMESLEGLHLPLLPDPQPLEEPDNAVWSTFADIVNGEGKAGGGDLTILDANEARQVRQIAGLLDNYPKAALVLESFELHQLAGGKALLAPERLNASIRNEEILHGVGRTPFMQQPAYAKTTATDARIKRAGLYYPGMVHGTDAARHAATFARDLRQDPELRRQAFPRIQSFR